MLQKSNASPILGLTDIPLFADGALPFAVALGKIVSPPSSTSELHKKKYHHEENDIFIFFYLVTDNNTYRYMRKVAIRGPPTLVMELPSVLSK